MVVNKDTGPRRQKGDMGDRGSGGQKGDMGGGLSHSAAPMSPMSPFFPQGPVVPLRPFSLLTSRTRLTLTICLSLCNVMEILCCFTFTCVELRKMM